MDEHVPAILNAWYPGEQGGTAVAEALFGDYNPADACRLPITAHWTIFLLLMIMPFKRTEHICILPVSLYMHSVTD